MLNKTTNQPSTYTSIVIRSYSQKKLYCKFIDPALNLIQASGDIGQSRTAEILLVVSYRHMQIFLDQLPKFAKIQLKKNSGSSCKD